MVAFGPMVLLGCIMMALLSLYERSNSIKSCDLCGAVYMTSAATKSVSAGTHSFVPSLSPEEMVKLDIKRVPQNAGETVEMQVQCHIMLSSACGFIIGSFICNELIYLREQ